MFKEKLFIFKNPGPEASEEPGHKAAPSLSSQGEKLPAGKTNFREIADESALELVNPINFVMMDVFGSNDDNAKLELGPRFTGLSKTMEAKAKEGFTYSGIEVGADFINILLTKGGKNERVSLAYCLGLGTIQPVFELLSDENRQKMEKALEEYSNQKALEFCIREVWPFLGKQKTDLKPMSQDEFLNSYLIKEEIFPSIKAGYKASAPYKFIAGKDSFLLKSGDPKYPDQKYFLSDYDEKLNLIEEDAYQSAVKYFNEMILPTLMAYRPNLSDVEIKNSYMVNQEIMPILIQGYMNKKPYKITSSDDGFVLECGLLGLFRSSFNFNDYDEKLNLIERKVVVNDPFELGQVSAKNIGGISVQDELKSTKELGVVDNLDTQYFDEDGNEISEEEWRENIKRQKQEGQYLEQLQQGHFPKAYGEWEQLKTELGELKPEDLARGIDGINGKFNGLISELTSGDEQLAQLDQEVRPAMDQLMTALEDGTIKNADSLDTFLQSNNGIERLQEKYEELSSGENLDERSKAALRMYGQMIEGMLELNIIAKTGDDVY